MCRMLGIVAARPVALQALLMEAPRSLAALSKEHPDGWGIASTNGDDWVLHKSPACAASCANYGRIAGVAKASLAIAHVRQKTVGVTSFVNTHPFRRGSIVLAHNGTVGNVAALVRRSSSVRLAEMEGETDSERLLAFLATHIDEAGDTEIGLARASRDLQATPGVGAVSFLLSDRRHLFAHRLGRTLYFLLRAPESEAATRRTRSVIVASEKLTDERWAEMDEGALLAISTGDRPTIRAVALA